MNIVTINNLGSTSSQDYTSLALEICNLVQLNIAQSNQGTYDSQRLDRLMLNKTVAAYDELINKSYMIALYEDTSLIACGFATFQDDRYFSKSLHVHPKYRGKGLAQYICKEREDHLKSIGASEVYIESLKFPNTIAFHKSRGYAETPPYKPLVNTILMKKNLKKTYAL